MQKGGDSLEKNWLTLIKFGDKKAFRQLYNAYANTAIRTASAITRNREQAKDAVQETFIRVYRQIGSYDESLPFDPWFYRILTNECLRVMKKEASHSKYVEQIELSAPYEEEHLFDLYSLIQSLEDHQRIPIILKYIKGFSEKEIAEILSLNQNTVKSRLFKGRKRLKEQLMKEDSE